MSAVAVRTCEVDGCDKPYLAKGMCKTHYYAAWEKANPRDRREYARKWRAENIEKYREQKRRHTRAYRARHPHKWFEQKLRQQYGLTVAEYDAIVDRQAGVCAICSRPPKTGRRLHIDHCHTTNVVRGLLCGSCNRAIGLLQDSPAIIVAAAAYLEGASR